MKYAIALVILCACSSNGGHDDSHLMKGNMNRAIEESLKSHQKGLHDIHEGHREHHQLHRGFYA